MKIASNARVKRRVLVGAVAAAGSLTLAACTGDAPVAPATTVTQTSSTTTTTSTTPPTTSTPPTSTAPSTSTNATDPVLAKIPEAARPNTQDGAEAFTRFFFSSLNEAYKKPDASRFDGLFAPTCKSCIAYRASAINLADRQERHSADTLTVTATDIGSWTDSERLILADIDQHAVDIIGPNGEIRGKTKADRGALAVTLRYQEHWVVEDIKGVAQ